MQRNSTSLLQAQCILRALCGLAHKRQTVCGPALGGVGNAELAAFELLPTEKRALQLGRGTHPLLTFAASDLYLSLIHI